MKLRTAPAPVRPSEAEEDAAAAAAAAESASAAATGFDTEFPSLTPSEGLLLEAEPAQSPTFYPVEDWDGPTSSTVVPPLATTVPLPAEALGAEKEAFFQSIIQPAAAPKKTASFAREASHSSIGLSGSSPERRAGEGKKKAVAPIPPAHGGIARAATSQLLSLNRLEAYRTTQGDEAPPSLREEPGEGKAVGDFLVDLVKSVTLLHREPPIQDSAEALHVLDASFRSLLDLLDVLTLPPSETQRLVRRFQRLLQSIAKARRRLAPTLLRQRTVTVAIS